MFSRESAFNLVIKDNVVHIRDRRFTIQMEVFMIIYEYDFHFFYKIIIFSHTYLVSCLMSAKMDVNFCLGTLVVLCYKEDTKLWID
jgi:hypothetical protein